MRTSIIILDLLVPDDASVDDSDEVSVSITMN